MYGMNKIALIFSVLIIATCDRGVNARGFVDCEACPEMVSIELDTAVFGSPENEHMRDYWETNQSIEYGCFAAAVGKYEVSEKQYGACVEHGACPPLSSQNEHVSRPKNWAQGYATLEAASAYVDWLSDITGKRYYLPDHKDWEVFARGGDTRPFPNRYWSMPGQDGYCEHSQYCDSGNFDCRERHSKPRPSENAICWLQAKSFGKPSKHGLYALTGGMHELTVPFDKSVDQPIVWKSCSALSDADSCRFASIASKFNTLEGGRYSGFRVFRAIECDDDN